MNVWKKDIVEQLDGKKRKMYDHKLYEVPLLIDAMKEICKNSFDYELKDCFIKKPNDYCLDLCDWAESLFRWMNVAFPFVLAVSVVYTFDRNKDLRNTFFSQKNKDILAKLYEDGGYKAIEQFIVDNFVEDDKILGTGKGI